MIGYIGKRFGENLGLSYIKVFLCVYFILLFLHGDTKGKARYYKETIVTVIRKKGI